ncbi:MAG: HAD family hydrolase [Burkholderiales bacterium]|jgi:D-glycero-D-manno-heptose 1,7-bisphosphate phosphatase|nr:HAD family hydrolase [Burkholderiales bacterium]
MSLPPHPVALQKLDDGDRSAAHPPADAAPLRPALFIDKDGTLVENVPYNVDPLLLRFMPGAGKALARLQRAGMALIIVSNQSGLARGMFTPAQFARLQQVLLHRLQAEFGVTIDGVEICPHGPDDEGRPTCLCRKPAPGMLIRAAHRHGVDLARSWMVGDTLDDVEAGHRAGSQGILFDSGGETVWRRSPLREPDARFSHWAALADHIEARLGGRLVERALADAP